MGRGQGVLGQCRGRGQGVLGQCGEGAGSTRSV